MKLKCNFAVMVFLIFSSSISMASNFANVKLSRGVELQIPKDWWLLTAQHNKMIETSVEAAMELSGLDAPSGVELNLISANSMPRSTYAAVRVDSISPSTVSPSVIKALTAADISAFGKETESGLKKILPQQGNRLLSFVGVRRVTISSQIGLMTEYKRSSPNGPVLVSIIQVFTPTQGVRINLSYRESEEAIWKPVIDKIYRSIKIKK